MFSTVNNVLLPCEMRLGSARFKPLRIGWRKLIPAQHELQLELSKYIAIRQVEAVQQWGIRRSSCRSEVRYLLQESCLSMVQARWMKVSALRGPIAAASIRCGHAILHVNAQALSPAQTCCQTAAGAGATAELQPGGRTPRCCHLHQPE